MRLNRQNSALLNYRIVFHSTGKILSSMLRRSGAVWYKIRKRLSDNQCIILLIRRFRLRKQILSLMNAGQHGLRIELRFKAPINESIMKTIYDSSDHHHKLKWNLLCC